MTDAADDTPRKTNSGRIDLRCKITESIAREILRRGERGEQAAPLAREFNLKPTLVRAVLEGRTWRHV